MATTTRVATRAIVTAPARVARGEVFEVRLLAQHPMESGHRADSLGRLLPRDIVRRVECTFTGQLVFAADLHPAIAANPYLSFALRATQGGLLAVRWRGDNGFEHNEAVNIEVVWSRLRRSGRWFAAGVRLAAVVASAVTSELAWAQAQPPAAARTEPRRSGLDDMSPALQAMQRDDAQNPAGLWLKAGEQRFAADCARCHDAGPSSPSPRSPRSMRGVATRYPAWDAVAGKPLTLAGRINACRVRHVRASAPWARENEDLLALEIFVARASRGLPIAPPQDARLERWRERGAALWQQPFGQMSLSCTQCHDGHAGGKLAGSTIPQAHPTGYPIYRLEWQGMGSLQRRVRNCMTGVRAEPFDWDADEMTALEAYLMQRAAGLPLETPGGAAVKRRAAPAAPIDPRCDLAALAPAAAMQAWLERAVIGLNLCPFAKAVHATGRIRWAQSAAADEEGLLADLLAELRLLARSDPAAIDTTVLVHPHVLAGFDAYNQFLDIADAALESLGLDGTIQVASFHPRYRFDGTAEDDITNCTNRAPYPALHLLREASVDAAVAAFPDAGAIYARNQRTLRRMGWAGWVGLWMQGRR